MCGAAMDVPLANAYASSEVFQAERLNTPGAVISGFIRLLPSMVLGPRLLKEEMTSFPVIKAPTVYAASSIPGDLRLEQPGPSLPAIVTIIMPALPWALTAARIM